MCRVQSYQELGLNVRYTAEESLWVLIEQFVRGCDVLGGSLPVQPRHLGHASSRLDAAHQRLVVLLILPDVFIRCHFLKLRNGGLGE